MKLLFSEALPDYKNYVFPYAIWAFPESGETPESFYARGFLPSSKDLDRFYLCRSLRVALRDFAPSSENRRILRKCEGIEFELLPASEVDFNEARRDFCLTYADIKFGKDIMTPKRLESLVSSKITSHFLLFREAQTGREIGLVMMYLLPPHVAQYYYAFYDLNYYRHNLGMFMMTTAVSHFAGLDFHHLYLGSCYSTNALYKTQFSGAEFFNGACWSRNLAELKYLITRAQHLPAQHLFETEDYVHQFYDGRLGNLVECSLFRI